MKYVGFKALIQKEDKLISPVQGTEWFPSADGSYVLRAGDGDLERGNGIFAATMEVASSYLGSIFLVLPEGRTVVGTLGWRAQGARVLYEVEDPETTLKYIFNAYLEGFDQVLGVLAESSVYFGVRGIAAVHEKVAQLSADSWDNTLEKMICDSIFSNLKLSKTEEIKSVAEAATRMLETVVLSNAKPFYSVWTMLRAAVLCDQAEEILVILDRANGYHALKAKQILENLLSGNYEQVIEICETEIGLALELMIISRAETKDVIKTMACLSERYSSASLYNTLKRCVKNFHATLDEVLIEELQKFNFPYWWLNELRPHSMG
jgi:hypothetical protein